MTTTSGVRNHVQHCSIAPKAFKDWFRGLVDGLADTPPSADQWAMVRAKIEALEESPPKFMTAQESILREHQRLAEGSGHVDPFPLTSFIKGTSGIGLHGTCGRTDELRNGEPQRG